MKAVEETAQWTSHKISEILELMEKTRLEIKNRLPKVYSRELADIIFSQPYCRIGNLVEAHIAKRQTASVYLKRLSEIGVLEEYIIGRERLFINPAFMTLLEH